MPEIAPASSVTRAPSSRRLEPLRKVDAGVLNIAYYEAGPADGPVVMLLHGFPYDIHSYVDVAPRSAAQGCRVIVSLFARLWTDPLSRQGDAALRRAGGDRRRPDGADGCACSVKRAVFAGYDWGGRAACVGGGAVAGALHRPGVGEQLSDPGHCERHGPVRCRSARSRFGINIISSSSADGQGCLPPTGAGSRKILWRQWSPNWHFDE